MTKKQPVKTIKAWAIIVNGKIDIVVSDRKNAMFFKRFLGTRSPLLEVTITYTPTSH